MALVVLLGAFAIIRAAHALWDVPPGAYVMVIAILTIASGRIAIKIPGRPASVSVSEVFVFASVLLFGPAPATLTVAVDGLLTSALQKHRRIDRTLFNVAEPAISAWFGGLVFFAIARVPPLAFPHAATVGVFSATLGMTATYFMLNTGLTALAVGLETGASPLAVWRGHALHLAINFYAAASLAALATKAGGGLNQDSIGLAVPLLVLSYFAYREAASRVNEAECHVRQVERLYEEARKRDDALRQAQKLEAIGRLAGGVAHDFNNMLTAISGYSELAVAELRPGPVREYIDEVLKAAERAAALTRQLLAFSRRQVVTPQILGIGRVVAEMEKMLQRLIGEDIALVTAIQPDVRPVCIDPTQLEQILLNLAVNARDAMPNGGSLRIELANAGSDGPAAKGALPAPAGYVRLSVTDTGCGMSEEVVSHLFEPFYTTKPKGRGTGLGLATVHGVVEQAQGTITIDTKIGNGTSFHVYFPASELAVSGAARAEAQSPKRGTETVLVVEDEPGVGGFLASALKGLGYRVLEAADGPGALEVASAHAGPIDVLLTDVVMPGLNGRELADRMLGRCPSTRVIFMSGYADDVVLRKGVQNGQVDFLQKPFSTDALSEKIRQVLVPTRSVDKVS